MGTKEWEPVSLAVEWSPLILTGPTMVGKTSIAATFLTPADALGMSTGVVTADKYYLYAGKDFQLGLGLLPDDLEEGRRAHLVGSLQPHDPLPSPAQYVLMAAAKVDELHAAGKMAIIEGCSFSYTMAALGHFGVSHAVHIIPPLLEHKVKFDIAEKLRTLWTLGLEDETRRALNAGYEYTYPMSSIIYRPMIQFIKGNLGRAQAFNRILHSWSREYMRTKMRYEQAFVRSDAH
jgi:tRNA A37 N6-isopentenylltransferase MiaA